MAGSDRSTGSDPAFQSYYRRYLRKFEERYEAFRRETAKERNLRMAAAVPAYIGGLAGTAILLMPGTPEGAWWALVVAAIVAGILLGFWAWLPTLTHWMRLDDQVVPRLVPFFGDLRFDSTKDLALCDVSHWGIVPGHHKKTTFDVLEGRWRGVDLRFAEMRLERRSTSRTTSSGSRQSTHTVFEGFYLELSSTTPYSGKVVIVASKAKLPEQPFLEEDKWRELPVTTEGFRVLATNDAAPALTASPRLLQELEAAKQRLKAKTLVVAFFGNTIAMLVERKTDFFDISATKKVDLNDAAETVGQQIAEIYRLIEIFDIADPDAEEVPADYRTPPRDSELASDADSEYNYREWGWGCIPTFVLFVLGLLGFGLLLRAEQSPATALWVAAASGLMLASGLYNIGKYATKSMSRVVTGLALIVGAAWLVNSKAPDAVSTLRSCVTAGDLTTDCLSRPTNDS